jgi:tetratricopeptide (TPR) repeat protein
MSVFIIIMSQCSSAPIGSLSHAAEHANPGACRSYQISYSRFSVKLALYISLVALSVSLLFRQIEWPWVLFRQAETAFEQGHYLDAAGLYERAAQKLDDTRVSAGLAKCWLALDRFEKAEVILARLLEEHPQQLWAIKLLAGVYQKMKQPAKAVPFFARYVALGGKLDSAAELQLARVYRQAALYDDAAPYYLKAASEPKQKTAAKVELAEMLGWQGRYDEAVQGFREVLAAEPANREARLNLARVLSWAGHYQESEDEYKRLLAKP